MCLYVCNFFSLKELEAYFDNIRYEGSRMNLFMEKYSETVSREHRNKLYLIKHR